MAFQLLLDEPQHAWQSMFQLTGGHAYGQLSVCDICLGSLSTDMLQICNFTACGLVAYTSVSAARTHFVTNGKKENNGNGNCNTRRSHRPGPCGCTLITWLWFSMANEVA